MICNASETKGRGTCMAIIVDFKRRDRAVATVAPKGAFKLLFFTGVRYERLPENPPVSRTGFAASSGRKSRKNA